MLDIEVLNGPVGSVLDIVSLRSFKKKLRITHTSLDDELEECLKDALSFFDWQDGILNRCILPRTVRRYLKGFPTGSCSADRAIQLPYPPVISVDAITIEDGESPENIVDPADWTFSAGQVVPTLTPKSYWPTVVAGPRAVSVTYTCGYDYQRDPEPEGLQRIRRMIKILAAHNFENPEATINEPRQMMVNRKVEFGLESDIQAMRIPVAYDDWGE